jgi:metallophosphoesterase (TIGR00282 family)
MISQLIFGDVVGDDALNLLGANLQKLKQFHNANTVIVNGENAFGGKGISEKQITYLKHLGVNAVTSGNHIWNNNTKHLLNQYSDYVLRPDNYYEDSLGTGVMYFELGFSLCAVVNLIGQSFMGHQVYNPFHHMDKILPTIRAKTKNVIVDFHAETTSEKIAMKWHLDGRVTALVGTHTHIQTNDAEVTENGTAYLTDLGMTGPYDSVIGMDKDTALYRFKTGLPNHYKIAKNNIKVCGVHIKFDEDTGKAQKITPFQYNSEQLNEMKV